MAIVEITVYKYKAGAECFIPHEDDGFLLWLRDPEETFVDLEKDVTAGSYTLISAFGQVDSKKCIADNYAVMVDRRFADRFCGQPLDGVDWEIGEVGANDVLFLGTDRDGYSDIERNGEIMSYVKEAEKLVTSLLERRKDTEPDFWMYTFYTVWTYWSSYDHYTGECDGGSEYVGVVDVGHAHKTDNGFVLTIS